MINPPSDTLSTFLPDSTVAPFRTEDLAELVVLQRCCWVEEALINDTLNIPALRETPDEVSDWAMTWTTLVVRREQRLVAAVRGRAEGADWQVGRLMVAPDLAGRGIGSALLGLIEGLAPPQVERFVLFTGARSERNIRLYQKAGYRISAVPGLFPHGHIDNAVHLVKPRM
ncbi:GNAT family N-acetyltransferase [Nocardia sp. NPDC051570]|uniref:GNAT family N-acetyltransferase n=1 Tax=Nocardia sp. NPDC051570 TaxID=3364324 RepID=UPI00379C76B5